MSLLVFVCFENDRQKSTVTLFVSNFGTFETISFCEEDRIVHLSGGGRILGRRSLPRALQIPLKGIRPPSLISHVARP